MNDAMVKEQARERLLSAELAEVLDVDVASIEQAAVVVRSPRRWLATALLLLGAAVVAGAAWLRSREAHDVHELQEREHDPTDLWWEHEWPAHLPVAILTSPDDVAALPDAEDEVVVVIEGKGDATLHAVLRRDRIRVLHIRNLVDAADLPWAELLRHEELHGLAFHGSAHFAPDQLRELRRLPDLESLAFHGTLQLDVATAEALLELPKLRHLGFVEVPIAAGAMRRLAGLTDLTTLALARLFGSEAAPDEFFAELEAIRALRGLLLDLGHPLTPENAQHLGRLPKLEDLGLWGTDCRDDALAELPPTLTSLKLFTLRGVSEQGMAELGKRLRLRCFGLCVAPPPAVVPTVAALFAVSPIERYDSPTLPDDAMVAALAGVPTLKRLTVVDGQRRLPELLGQLSRLTKLEMLHVHAAMPERPQQLTPLRGHPALRRIVFQLNQEPSRRPGEAELAALRDAAGCDVEVR